VPKIEKLVREVICLESWKGKVITDQVVIRTNTHTEVDTPAADDVSSETERESKSKTILFLKIIGTRTGSEGSPARKVHLDFAPKGTRTHLRKYHPITTKEASSIMEANDELLAQVISLYKIRKYYNGPR